MAFRAELIVRVTDDKGHVAQESMALERATLENCLSSFSNQVFYEGQEFVKDSLDDLKFKALPKPPARRRAQKPKDKPKPKPPSRPRDQKPEEKPKGPTSST